MDPTAILSALARFGVTTRRYPGWETRKHGNLDPHVIMVRDSVTGHMTPEQAAKFCIAGRTDLAGPLYECLIGPDGQAHLIANGLTWNAGVGNADRLWQARHGVMPIDFEMGRPDPDTYNGNLWSHAIAMITYGAGPYTPDQLEACARVCAAYCVAENWDPPSIAAGSIIGHGEFSARKVDPFADMGVLRRRVVAILEGSKETWHVVKSGETLWSLSRLYGTPVVQLRMLNHLDSDTILIGWRLRVR